MNRAGLAVHKNTNTEKVTKDEATGELTLHTKDGKAHGGFGVILMAIGESVLHVLKIVLVHRSW